MKAILEYSLPDEADDYEFAMNGAAYYSALRFILEYIHDEMGEHDISSIQFAVLEKINHTVHGFLDSNDVDI